MEIHFQVNAKNIGVLIAGAAAIGSAYLFVGNARESHAQTMENEEAVGVVAEAVEALARTQRVERMFWPEEYRAKALEVIDAIEVAD